MSSTPSTRPSLLLRVRDPGDTDAWHEFVRIYTPLIFNHCRRHGLQDTDAADVSQEVMRVVAREMPGFRYDSGRGKFRGWLLQTTRFRLYRFLERRERLPRATSDTTIERMLDAEAESRDERLWEAEYRQRLFDWAVEKVRGEFQSSTWDAFWLTAVDQISVKEVAERVGISVGAVYIARSRVVARLRAVVETVSDEPVID